MKCWPVSWMETIETGENLPINIYLTFLLYIIHRLQDLGSITFTNELNYMWDASTFTSFQRFICWWSYKVGVLWVYLDWSLSWKKWVFFFSNFEKFEFFVRGESGTQRKKKEKSLSWKVVQIHSKLVNCFSLLLQGCGTCSLQMSLVGWK